MSRRFYRHSTPPVRFSWVGLRHAEKPNTVWDCNNRAFWGNPNAISWEEIGVYAGPVRAQYVRARTASRETGGAGNEAESVQGAAFRSGSYLSRRKARCVGGNPWRRGRRTHRQAGYLCAGDYGFREADASDRGRTHHPFQ